MGQSPPPTARTASPRPVALRVEAAGPTLLGNIVILFLQLAACALLASNIHWDVPSETVVGTIFLLLLAAYIWSTLRKLVDIRTFGELKLDLIEPLPASGGMLRGTLRFRKPLPAGSRALVEFRCIYTRYRYRRRGKTRIAQETLWASKQELTLAGLKLPLTLAIPDGLPGTLSHGPTTCEWELQVRLDLPGVDFNRTYILPVTGDLPAASPKKPTPPLPDIPHSKPGPASALFLVMANLALLAGALYWNWQLRELVFIFWIENLIVGVFNVVRIAVCQPPQHLEEATSPKLFMIAFFAFHYGMFCFVHGLFLLSMFAEGDGRDFDDISAIFAIVANNPELLQGVAALFISHLFSFFHNFIGRGEYRRTESGRLMMQPYGRIIVVHMFIIMGGIILNDFANPVLGLILFVGLKTLMDLGSHVVEHNLMQRQPPETA